MTPKQYLAVGLIKADDAILLVHEDYGLRLWALPSGYVEGGESFAEAAVRETREETGLETTVIGVVAVRERPDQLVIAFALERVGGDQVETVPGEIDAVRWFRRTEFEGVRTQVNDFAALLAERAFEGKLATLPMGTWRGRDGRDAALFLG